MQNPPAQPTNASTNPVGAESVMRKFAPLITSALAVVAVAAIVMWLQHVPEADRHYRTIGVEWWEKGSDYFREEGWRLKEISGGKALIWMPRSEFQARQKEREANHKVKAEQANRAIEAPSEAE